jgi:hypothetical protein
MMREWCGPRLLGESRACGAGGKDWKRRTDSLSRQKISVNHGVFDLHPNKRRELSERGINGVKRVAAVSVERAGGMQFPIAIQAGVVESITNRLSNEAA